MVTNTFFLSLFFTFEDVKLPSKATVGVCFLGSIHLRAEISGLEFWPVFQAEISGLFYSGPNSRPEFQAKMSSQKIPCRNIMTSLEFPGF